MALDATVGGAAANSYLTVAAADLLNGDRLGSYAARWTAADAPTKEKALIQATADIDAFVHPAERWSDGQLLAFPRAIDVDDALAPFIPMRVQVATFEQALYLLVNIDQLERAATRRARGLYTFDEDEGPSGTLALDSQLGLLAPRAEALLTSFVGSARGGYVGSMRIKSAMVHAAEQGS